MPLDLGASMNRRRFVGLLGGAVPWWAVARAQQAMPSIGFLTASKLPDWAMGAARKGLGEAGYEEGRNLIIVYRSAEGQTDRLAALAADLIENQVSVILASGGPIPARVAKSATTTIPIVFAYGGDPVADGLVASFNRPGGNVTGATFIGSPLSAKRLELLRAIMPRTADVALLVNPKGTLAESQIEDARAAVKALGQDLHVIDAGSKGEIDDAFEKMGRLKVGALLVGTDPLFAFLLRDQIVALASRYRIPAAYDSRSYVEAGGLISYGTNLSDTWRQAGVYVGRILKGEKPADLPVIQEARYEMVINLEAAKALGLAFSPGMLATADDVIE
jgi:putative tryptophan/tyrosine transport system substrate-binding protein